MSELNIILVKLKLYLLPCIAKEVNFLQQKYDEAYEGALAEDPDAEQDLEYLQNLVGSSG